MLARQPQDQLPVQGLGEAGVGDGGGDALRLQVLGGLHRLGEAGAEGEEGDGRPLAQHPAAADLQRRGPLGDLDAHALAAGIAEGDGAAVVGDGGRDHAGELRLVRRGHHRHARQVGEIPHVEGPGVGGAVGPHQPRPVDGEAHRQALQRHVMHHLVVGPLQEGGIDRAERLHARGRQPRGEGHRMLLGDAHVEHPVGKTLAEDVEPGAVGHRGGDADDALVALRLPDQGVGEDLGVGRRVGGRLLLRPGRHVELGDAVVAVGAGLGGLVALALLGDRVDQHRPVRPRLDGAQHRQDLAQVMPVDGPHIGEPQRLEQGAADGELLEQVLGAARPLPERPRQQAGRALGHRGEVLEGLARPEAGEVARHRPHGRGDRHLVVVEDHDELRAERAGVVHRLVGHARRHRPVADHRDGVPALAEAEIARRREAQRRRDRGRGMRRPERVVGAFRALGEAREPAPLAQRPDPVAPAGEDLVRIGLVADVPDQLVAGRVEDGVDGDGQLHHAQARAQVPAGLGDGGDGLGPQLVGEPLQLGVREAAHVRRTRHPVQQRGARAVGMRGLIGHAGPWLGGGVMDRGHLGEARPRGNARPPRIRRVPTPPGGPRRTTGPAAARLRPDAPVGRGRGDGGGQWLGFSGGSAAAGPAHGRPRKRSAPRTQGPRGASVGPSPARPEPSGGSGGRYWARTSDPSDVNTVLYQLS